LAGDTTPRLDRFAPRRLAVTKRVIVGLVLSSLAACGPRVDLAKAVAPASVVTGWVDGGTVAGKNKIVPAVSFRLKNVSGVALGPVQANAVFHRVNDPAEWSAAFVPNVAREIAPGAETTVRTAAGPQGYTGADDRAALLHNSHFIDATAELFVKSGSSNWTRIGEFPIARQFIEPESR
jgi:hypothetical protein